MTNQFIDDILVTCFEGGSVYWIGEIHAAKNVPGTKHFSEVVAQGGELDITDDDGQTHRLTNAAIRKGINMALSGRQIKDKDYDAYDADSALQYALFGEVVYG